MLVQGARRWGAELLLEPDFSKAQQPGSGQLTVSVPKWVAELCKRSRSWGAFCTNALPGQSRDVGTEVMRLLRLSPVKAYCTGLQQCRLQSRADHIAMPQEATASNHPFYRPGLCSRLEASPLD